MNLTDRPSPSPEIVLRADFSDHALLFHPLFDDMVGLTPVALATWRALDGRRTVAEVAALVRAQFDGAPASVTEDVAAFLSSLERRGFVLTEPEMPESAGTRRLPPSPRLPVSSSPHPPFVLALADGSRLRIRAGDEPAARVVAQFAASASLTHDSEQQEREKGVEVLVVTDSHAAPQDVAENSSI